MILSSGSTLTLTLPKTATVGMPETLNMQDLERRHILDVLEKTAWRVMGAGGAAEILGMKRTTLQARMKKLGIKRPAT
jgi:transcriptional regulator with GAF, ATPase, and Fis domain